MSGGDEARAAGERRAGRAGRAWLGARGRKRKRRRAWLTTSSSRSRSSAASTAAPYALASNSAHVCRSTSCIRPCSRAEASASFGPSRFTCLSLRSFVSRRSESISSAAATGSSRAGASGCTAACTLAQSSRTAERSPSSFASLSSVLFRLSLASTCRLPETIPSCTRPICRRAVRHRIADIVRSDSICCTCDMPCTNAPYERITRAESCELIESSTTCVCEI